MTQRRRIPPGPVDDDDEWMAVLPSLPDAEIDALLAGDPSASIPGELSEFIDALRRAAVLQLAPVMSEALRLQVNRGVPRPVAARRRRLLAGALGSLLLGGTAIGVAGAQELLPAPVQDAASSAADFLGFDLPRASERHADPDRGVGGQDDQGDGAGGTDDPGGAKPATPGPTDSTDGTPGTGNGPPATTPGGAVPADPGTPHDGEPATPATPATGQGSEKGNNASEIGKGSNQN